MEDLDLQQVAAEHRLGRVLGMKGVLPGGDRPQRELGQHGQVDQPRVVALHQHQEPVPTLQVLGDEEPQGVDVLDLLGAQHVQVHGGDPVGDGVLVGRVLAVDQPSLIVPQPEPLRVVEGVGGGQAGCRGRPRRCRRPAPWKLNRENRLLRLKVPTVTSTWSPSHARPPGDPQSDR